ncbi:hypothetical protein Emtol_1253 [Emticicia oligotrophica DSM 17448]|uniref:Nucleotidyltransferase family protein n=1 Tax=Emticicia oligotrophica (strain DSM 17448 / CIP 109782 / MTCC 6937 / GPTSA100-15) TaxID=929562 RepID=A0ABN4AJW0_EMTOG|nr:nucleotidyltransferase family protein [Emticicia oligotrophica]AFK02402.1 hypothetical protein Emtol_1253 [Emticicia oligotrophica DSM 17448]
MKIKELKISLELQILIESIKVVLLDEPTLHFSSLINLSSVDWERIKKMLAYHRIRPVFYEACRRVGFSNMYIQQLEKFVKIQVLSSLTDKNELENISTILQEKNIEVLPYKGILFSEKLYHNLALRESSDIDIIVKEEHAKEGLKALLNAGFEVKIEKKINLDFSNENVLDNLLKIPSRELSLRRKQKRNEVRNIDYHWAISEKYRGNVINIEDFFKDIILEDFGKKKIWVPNPKGIFKLLLNHHGGRDCWMRLKDVCDLIAFRSKYSYLDIKLLLKYASEMQMVRTFELGMYLCENLSSKKLKHVEKDYKIVSKVIESWEDSIQLSDNSQLFKYFSLYRHLQDEKLNWWGTFLLIVKVLSTPHILEHRRLITFSEQYVLLNAFAKALSFVYYKLLKKKLIDY